MKTKKQMKKELAKMTVKLAWLKREDHKYVLDLLKTHHYPGNSFFDQPKVDWLMACDPKFRSKVLNRLKEKKR